MTRFAHFLTPNGEPQFAEVAGDLLVPLQGISTLGPEITPEVLSSAQRLDEAAVPSVDVRLLPASPDPAKVLCVGLNYASHVAEVNREMPDYPVLFPKFASNLIGPTDDIVVPAESTGPDYEGEMAVIIGRPGRRIAEKDAFDHVLGFSVSNDVSMRDYQYKSHQWLQGKAWDDSTPLGPHIVTPGEVDLAAAGIRTTVNGRTLQEATLSMMMFSVPTLISTISEFTRLDVGDVILTGTPAGIGSKRDPKVILRNGDTVAVEIDGIGRIENTVVTK
ncbi:fumarylacetoacetate hydrolase family protein [Brevibacterium atlanticum]|uniref:fumarylacetoacetate hydrolase family protein n=1 Tax=Brevibacterium atlanticum TaxID=2697563 RepID=UPI0014204AB7|nr:fumarylacetoacetate hydrolase family protein [Brevibacterium atlanticum]